MSAAAPSPDAVVGSVAGRRAFDPRRGLLGLGAFAGGGVGLSALYASTGMGLPCPLRSLTGLDCPLCGGTRLGAALLRGDVAGAFAANPLLLVVLVALTALGLAWMVELAGGPRWRPPALARRWSARLGPTGWTLTLVGLTVVYAVLRNLFFPI